ncbi:type II toxin-antitoxin system RelE/ParE family toxin [Filimonas effusa]|uniref:Peptidase n=1 Tax=Filimonas effusa TaxID=2508721 RepID=A0A4Q1D6L3_9BACT|nr:type II toxin-antitoxin system RelE/ParE family toxin [Filimonas effusa]RXK83297.1 peptidase [Filimonas effusa]
MIASIHHKGLKLFWTRGDASRLAPGQVKKIRNILTMLDNAVMIEDLNYPGSGLHSLKGNLADYWAVSVTGNWRIIFRFIDGDAHLVDYLDYH